MGDESPPAPFAGRDGFHVVPIRFLSKNGTTWKSSLPGTLVTMRVGKTSDLATKTKGLIRCFLRLGRGGLVVVTGILALGCLAVAFSMHSVLKTLWLAQPTIFLFATLTCAPA